MQNLFEKNATYTTPIDGMSGMVSENLFQKILSPKMQLFFLKDTSGVYVVGSYVVTTSADGFCKWSFSSIFLAFFSHVRTAHNPKVVGSSPAPAIH